MSRVEQSLEFGLKRPLDCRQGANPKVHRDHLDFIVELIVELKSVQLSVLSELYLASSVKVHF